MSESADARHDEARALAALGFRIFPCWWTGNDGQCACGRSCERARSGKHPLHLAVPRGVLQATTDRDQIDRWWSHWPQANIGLATGGGVVVIDIDSPQAFDAFAATVRSSGGFVSPPPISRTGRGGYHIWLRTATPIPSSSGRIAQSIDVRGEGGYVIVPPSTNGYGAYRWVPNRGLDQIALPPIPEWLARLAANPRGARDVLQGVARGLRQTSLFQYASSLRARNTPLDEAIALVQLAAERCAPPFPADEAEKLVRRIYARYAPSRPVSEFTITPASSITVEQPKWLWEPFLPQGDPVILASPGGYGKSTASLAIASFVTTGLWPFGPATDPQSALIISAEDHPARTIVPKLSAMRADLAKALILDPIPVLPRDTDALLSLIRSVRPGLVILDPITAMLDTRIDTHRDAAIRVTLSPLVKECRELDATLLIIMHHTKHSTSNTGDPQFSITGSVAFPALARTVLFVKKGEENRRKLVIVKSNYVITGQSVRFALTPAEGGVIAHFSTRVETEEELP